MELIPVRGGHLGVEIVGRGPTVIFLHGGPGDTHHYMKRMAEPLFGEFRCVLFDQRGTGASSDIGRNPAEFTMDRLFDDLIRVADHACGATGEKPALVGHSWGAMYALYAGLEFPEKFSRAALLNMGPLDAEMERATSEHLTSVLTDAEKGEWADYQSQRNAARDRGDIDAVNLFDEKLMRLRVKAWVYNPALREEFLKDYFQDPPPDREVNRWIWEAQQGWFSWEKKSSTPMWIAVGANDSVPVAQAERLAAAMPASELRIFTECGHIPWLEQRREFDRELRAFLGG
ncbi:MAG: alpha/beta hydrolase [Bdellovibrionaceae bacterium]|nr:alpha/beta hydrolase [Pseudobdellovibrionaceae bacterium]